MGTTYFQRDHRENGGIIAYGDSCGFVNGVYGHFQQFFRYIVTIRLHGRQGAVVAVIIW